jgi:hypothetical protein
MTPIVSAIQETTGPLEHAEYDAVCRRNKDGWQKAYDVDDNINDHTDSYSPDAERP